MDKSKMLMRACFALGKPGIKWWMSYAYKNYRGHKPNFKDPKDLSEMMLSSMLKPDFVKYAPYVDKVKVRDYVKSKGLSNTLLDIYGVWDRAEDIDFESLPSKFALKPNNGSGGHYFCKNKAEITDWPTIVRRMNSQLKLGVEYKYEPQYAYIKPQLYAEELMDLSTSPIDYKFYCVRGHILDIDVCVNRIDGHANHMTYTVDWEIGDTTLDRYLPSKDLYPKRPAHLDEMINIAQLLSEDFDIVRVDLYEYNDKVYFGELTFSPWGGFLWQFSNEGIERYGKMARKILYNED